MIHIPSFSTGLSSAITTERVLQRYGAANVLPVFQDTKFEDEDNYRFMADCERRWRWMYGLKEIVKISEGRTPYQVFTDQRIIPNTIIAPCTFELKIDLFREWLTALTDSATVYIGYDFTEAHRCGPTEKNYKEAGYGVGFPLLWKPYEYREYKQVVQEDWGIAPPRMYGMGYTHANCGGRCIKQGQGDWIRTLINFPDRFYAAEEWEQGMRQLSEKHANYAILKEQKTIDGKRVSFPLTLQELRERYERKQIGAMDLPKMDEQSACIHCGVGDFIMPKDFILTSI